MNEVTGVLPAETTHAQVVAERGRLELLLRVVLVELVALGVVDGLPGGDDDVHDWIIAARVGADGLAGAHLAHVIAGWCTDVFRVRREGAGATGDPAAQARHITRLWHQGAVLMDDLRLLARTGVPAPPPQSSG